MADGASPPRARTNDSATSDERRRDDATTDRDDRQQNGMLSVTLLLLAELLARRCVAQVTQVHDLVITHPANRSFCATSACAVSISAYVDDMDRFLRDYEGWRLDLVVDGDTVSVRDIAAQTLVVAFGADGRHTLSARLCDVAAGTCVATAQMTHVVTARDVGSGRVAPALVPRADALGGSAGLVPVVVRHLRQPLSAAVTPSVKITYPGDFNGGSRRTAVCLVVSGYLVLPSYSSESHEGRCFIRAEDGVPLHSFHMSGHDAFASAVFLDADARLVIARTDYYMPPAPRIDTAGPGTAPPLSQTLSPAPLGVPAVPWSGCVRVAALYDAAVSEGFYWHDSGLDAVMALRGTARVCPSGPQILVIDPFTPPDAADNTGASRHLSCGPYEALAACVDRHASFLMTNADLVVVPNAVKPSSADDIDRDSYDPGAPPGGHGLSALAVLQAISARRAQLALAGAASPKIVLVIDALHGTKTSNLLPAGFEIDAFLVPSLAVARHPDVTQFAVPTLVAPPLLLLAPPLHASDDALSADAAEEAPSQSSAPACARLVLHVSTGALDYVSAFLFLEVAEMVAAATANEEEEVEAGEDVGAVCFRVLVPSPLVPAVAAAARAMWGPDGATRVTVGAADAPTLSPPLHRHDSPDTTDTACADTCSAPVDDPILHPPSHHGVAIANELARADVLVLAADGGRPDWSYPHTLDALATRVARRPGSRLRAVVSGCSGDAAEAVAAEGDIYPGQPTVHVLADVGESSCGQARPAAPADPAADAADAADVSVAAGLAAAVVTALRRPPEPRTNVNVNVADDGRVGAVYGSHAEAFSSALLALVVGPSDASAAAEGTNRKIGWLPAAEGRDPAAEEAALLAALGAPHTALGTDPPDPHNDAPGGDQHQHQHQHAANALALAAARALIAAPHRAWRQGAYPDVDMTGFATDAASTAVTAYLQATARGVAGDTTYNYLHPLANHPGPGPGPGPAMDNTTATATAAASTRRGDRLLCMTYTITPRHSSVKAIMDTWGKRCDGYLAASNSTNATINTFRFARRGPEVFHNIWQKVRAAVMVVDAYLMDGSPQDGGGDDNNNNGGGGGGGGGGYDWLLISGDDTYVLLDGLRTYLASTAVHTATRNGTRAAYLGGTWTWNRGLVYPHGGGGHLLNRHAVRLFAAAARGGRCFSDAFAPMEDILVANCLASCGVRVHDTRDALRRARFHAVSPSARLVRPPTTIEGFSWGLDSRWNLGLAAIAPDSVSFHFFKAPASMRFLHWHLYYYH